MSDATIDRYHEALGPEKCTCPKCWPVPPVRRIGDLSARHIGMRITIPDLHQPGEDWDAPRVSVSGRLDGLTSAYGKLEVWVKLRPKTVELDRPLPISWPCEVTA